MQCIVNYRPQTKFGARYYFHRCLSLYDVTSSLAACSHVPSRGGGFWPWSLVPSGGLCPGETLSRWVSVQGILCPGETLSLQVSVQGRLCPGGSLSGGSLSRRGVSVQEGGLCPGGGLCSGWRSLSRRGVSVQDGGPCAGEGSLSWRGVSVLEGDLGPGGLCRETPWNQKSGTCASYWNPFLFILAFAAHQFRSAYQIDTGQARLIRSHSSAGISFKISGNTN